MDKVKPILLATALLCSLGMMGCGNNPQPSQTSQVTSTSEEQKILSLTLYKTGVNTSVYGGAQVTLTYDIQYSGSERPRVTWTSSNPDIASVVNGVVNFYDVDEDREVTITVTARDDETKTDSITFTVSKCVIDLVHSRPDLNDGSIDISDIGGEGISIPSSANISALMMNGVKGTKWYIEATFTINDFSEDAWPKIGLMAGSNESGYYNYANSKNIGWLVDAQKVLAETGWKDINMVHQNPELSDWDWTACDNYKSEFSKLEMGKSFKLGLLRVGSDFFGYSNIDGSNLMLVHYQSNYIEPTEDLYASIVAWGGLDYNVRNFVVKQGDEVDSLLANPKSLSVNGFSILPEESQKLSVTCNTMGKAYDPSKITFTSTYPEICTVDVNGVVTGVSKGLGEIVVKYGDVLETKVQIEVYTVEEEVNLITTPYTFTGNNWNVKVYTALMDGSRSFKVHYKLTDVWATDVANMCFAVDVNSPGWSAGGATFSPDWCGWGTWMEGIPEHYHGFDGVSFEEYKQMKQNCNLDATIAFDATNGQIRMEAKLTSNVSGYEGKVCNIWWQTKTFTYRGPLEINIGQSGDGSTLTNGTVSINYFAVVYGGLAS